MKNNWIKDREFVYFKRWTVWSYNTTDQAFHIPDSFRACFQCSWFFQVFFWMSLIFDGRTDTSYHIWSVFPLSDGRLISLKLKKNCTGAIPLVFYHQAPSSADDLSRNGNLIFNIFHQHYNQWLIFLFDCLC